MLVDTQVVFWLAQVPSMLTDVATKAIRDARRETGATYISDKTLWELAMMIHRGVVDVRTTPRDFLDTVSKLFKVLPITPAVAERSVQFSRNFPRDPSDRIIAATALVHGYKLVTADEAIRLAGEVPCIW